MFSHSNKTIRCAKVVPQMISQRGMSSFLKKHLVDDSYQHKPIFQSKKMDFQELVSHVKHTGFIYPGSDLYGGLKGSFDYGPLGIGLKKKIMAAWSKVFVQNTTDCVPLDSSIILHPKVWNVAGHVENFTDPLVECKHCHIRHRVDKLIEDAGMTIDVNPTQIEAWTVEVTKKFESLNFKCNCGKCDFTIPRPFNLLMTTSAGSVPTYLRPETAQGVFLNHVNVKRSLRKNIPFGIGQIGKAFRNEISPRDFLYRLREFEQMELEYFCDPDQSTEKYHEYIKKCQDFLTTFGIKPESVRAHEYHGAELAHYALGTTDLEYNFPFGWGELWGIANRGDYDLKKHNSGQVKITNPSTDRPDAPADREYPYTYFPHVIEPSVGVDRLVLAFLHDGLNIEDTAAPLHEDIEPGKSERIVFNIHPDLAPIKMVIAPLITKDPEIMQISNDLQKILSQYWDVALETTATIGKRYARADEIGVPWVLCVDTTSVSEQKVTIRSRDSRQQTTFTIDEVIDIVKRNERFPL